MQKSRMQVLAVTGGAQGIDRAVALHFAKAGYAVSIADTNARACLFLARDAGFMTGQNLTLDGGMSVKMIYAA